MEVLEEDYKKLKDRLFETLHSKSDSEMLKNIVKVKNMDEELQELIILLYSNYKAELEIIKQNNLELTSNLVDINIKLLNKLQKRLVELHPDKKQKTENTGWFHNFMQLPNVTKVIISLVVSIGILIGMYKVAPDATNQIFGFFKDVFASKTVVQLNK